MPGNIEKRGPDAFRLEVTIGTDFKGTPCKVSKNCTLQNKQKLLLANKWTDSDYVLVDDFGAPMFPRNLSRWFGDFIRAQRLRKITFHQLRHTHTSLLAYVGTDKYQISKRLGHSQLSTTLNTYMHILEDTDKEAAERLNQFYIQKDKV